MVVEAASADDIAAVLTNPGKYPSPVRAVGCKHSTTPCGAADGGTLIQMSKLNQILEITADTVTAQAGANYIDAAKEIEKKNLQFYVNTEIGSLSVGSAACCGTKDASMPGEYGQVSRMLSKSMQTKSDQKLLIVDPEQQVVARVRRKFKASIPNFDTSRIIRMTGDCADVLPKFLGGQLLTARPEEIKQSVQITTGSEASV